MNAPQPDHLLQAADAAQTRFDKATTPREKAAAERELLEVHEQLQRHLVTDGVTTLIKRAQKQPHNFFKGK